MTGIITAASAALLSAAAFMRLKDIKESDKEDRRNIFWLVTALSVFLAADITAAVKLQEYGTIRIVNLALMINFMFLAAVTDIRHRVIPNLYIAGAMGIRTVIAAVQGISGHILAKELIHSLAGAAAGFLILGVVSVISGKGLGAGDVKLFAAAGYFTGLYGVVDILLFTTVLCAVCGLILVLTKKCSIKDCIPMAPFAFAGTMVYVMTAL